MTAFLKADPRAHDWIKKIRETGEIPSSGWQPKISDIEDVAEDCRVLVEIHAAIKKKYGENFDPSGLNQIGDFLTHKEIDACARAGRRKFQREISSLRGK